MKLSKLLGQETNPDITITNVCDDSRQLQAGDVFFLDSRQHKDYPQFIEQAAAKKAAFIVCDIAAAKHIKDTPYITVERPLAFYSQYILDSAPKPKHMVAVTGTNGKTSVAWFFKELLTHAGLKAGSIGTLGVYAGSEKLTETGYTTPTAQKMCEALSLLDKQKVEYLCLEASSHGIELGRLEGLTFQASGFTNLTQDHFDFHGGFDGYMRAKLGLFDRLTRTNGCAVIQASRMENIPVMMFSREKGLRLLTYGVTGAEVVVRLLATSGMGSKVEVAFGDYASVHQTRLVGAFQAENLACAIGLALGTGLSIEKICEGLANINPVPGRMEPVPAQTQDAPAVIIDYAHTPAGLETALKAARPLTKGKLWVLFGCGGDRDTKKRPQMGDVAQKLADKVIVSDDNPRTEDASIIRKEIMSACPQAENIGGRREAIAHAIKNAAPEDVVLIAGKGHEQGQIVGKEVLPHNDFEVALTCLKNIKRTN